MGKVKKTAKKTAKKRKRVTRKYTPQEIREADRLNEISSAWHSYMETHPDPWERAKYNAWMSGSDGPYLMAHAYDIYHGY
jgi:hypothetical protein